MKQSPYKRVFSSDNQDITMTWAGEGSIWAKANVTPPPADPDAYARLVTGQIQVKLIVPRPNINVSLTGVTEDVASYVIDGGGEPLVDYGFKILTPEQSTVDYLGHCMLEALRQY